MAVCGKFSVMVYPTVRGTLQLVEISSQFTNFPMHNQGASEATVLYVNCAVVLAYISRCVQCFLSLYVIAFFSWAVFISVMRILAALTRLLYYCTFLVA